MDEAPSTGDWLTPVPTPSLVDIYTGRGAVKLVVAYNTIIAVSPQVLAASSPVFRVMFDGPFKEGRDIEDDSEPCEIPLPDDDAEAMTGLCNLLHHRNYLLPKAPTLNFYHAFAEVIDKYDCSAAAEFLTHVWRQAFFKSEVDAHGWSRWHQLAEAAYLLNDAEAFKWAINRLTRKVTPAQASQLRQSHGRIHTKLFDNITKLIAKLTMELRVAIMKGYVFPLSSYEYPDGDYYNKHGRDCKHGTSKNGVYQPGLHDWVLAASTKIMANSINLSGNESLLEILSKTKVVWNEREPIRSVGHRYYPYGQYGIDVTEPQMFPSKDPLCRACSFDFDAFFEDLVRQVKAGTDIFCLKCVKSGKLDNEDELIGCKCDVAQRSGTQRSKKPQYDRAVHDWWRNTLL